jgi:nicotinamide-nucleotide amidase
MRGLYEDELLAVIKERLGASEHVVRTRTLRTTAVAESQLPTLLGDAAGGFDGMSLAYLPGEEGVDADARLARGIDLLRERVGIFAYAEGRNDMADTVLNLCREQALTIAVAESCTGGMLGQRLTAIPGSSDVFLGGVIAYSNGAKVSAVGVSVDTIDAVGAVSEAVARELAAGVRERLGADIGVGITGIAGPGGGTLEKPVGLVWIAIDVRGSQKTHGGRMIGDRAEIRFRATQRALDMIRRALLAAP